MFKTMKECTDFIFTLKAVDHKRAPLVLMREVLAFLNNPQDKLRVIHLAGSNGKGSTVNALREMLQLTGYKVGAFTSPHLERVNERMTINGMQINDAQFLHYMNKVAEIIETHHEGEFPSFFEVVTLIMFQYFADEEVDFALIETGLGGRLDATNVVTPLISIITTISLEHTAFLGDTLAKVAFEKAGIIKESVPVVVGVKSEEALSVISEVANDRHAPCLVLGKDFTVENMEQSTDMQHFNYRKANEEMEAVPLKMAGSHQINNASLAITAILTLRENGVIDISDALIRQALARAQWAGRFEQLPGDIILDGAHNSEGTAALIQTLKTVYPHQNYRFIYAALSDKDHAKSIALMDSIATSIAFTQIELPNAMPADQLAALSTNTNKIYNANWCEMVQMMLHQRNDEDVIVITGSLYFIAEIRQWLQGEQR
ncbi:bifunctional folylpolyglutamate synthase/dihydrofolate synthase [Lysinibacillus xylanilyticus]|uniref:bifunctional folylpolyglutamate synthase/dihydrofolate synthase n=1 Tax=Lysinibacillus xylanilyticus TaxID=582475 RepID=UPI002B252161|nr:folylpolyglutamate synthase/dihydrofolate synthase family protein [Lysinibacillus xylanilyticus]MEB2300000.1 bifunctional folylpolyglutamate synthase/dihydrofolate synthase [Lysinibacillus xylanilyticus]